jgi:hypothetical protein
VSSDVQFRNPADERSSDREEARVNKTPEDRSGEIGGNKDNTNLKTRDSCRCELE